MTRVNNKVATANPFIISEKGWPNQGDHTKDAVSSKVNAMKYFINKHEWVTRNNIKLLCFSSFDEPGKVRHESDAGARWGLWYKNRKLKFN